MCRCPPPVKAMIRKAWAANVKGPDGKPVYVVALSVELA